MVVTKHWDVLAQCDWTQLWYHGFTMNHKVLNNQADSKHPVKHSYTTASQTCKSRAGQRQSSSAVHPVWVETDKEMQR